jgi:transposase IS116/IS110/IS902 family protein
MQRSVESSLEREEVKRLMTIPGVDATVALSIVAAVGDFGPFHRPERLVPYLGLNPRVHESGIQPASHGRITKHARRTPAGCSSRRPGSLWAPRARSGHSMTGSARAAGGRSPSPRPPASSLGTLELRVGMPAQNGRKGKAAARPLPGTLRGAHQSPSLRCARVDRGPHQIVNGDDAVPRPQLSLTLSSVL